MIAALFVDPRGIYPRLLGAENCWDERRDARTYSGDAPVIAHPPCQRWGRYWSGGPSAAGTKQLGDDGGCFDFALSTVRRVGGVLEHPEGSHAFRRFGLGEPTWRKGWEASADGIGHVCCVAQGNYGHRARKLTWLYAVSTHLPDLDWSIPGPMMRLDDGAHSAQERERGAFQKGERITKQERIGTPFAFTSILIEIATRCRAVAGA